MADVAERAHRNLCDFTRFLARLEPTAALLDERGAVVLRSPVDWPSARMAVRESPELPASDFVDAVESFLLGHGRSSCVFIRDGVDEEIAKTLLDRGFTEYGNSPEMVCEAELAELPSPAGTTVRLATSAEDVRAYADIAARAFVHLGFQEEPTRVALDNPDVMLGSDVAISLAEIDGKPVAGACSVLVGDEPNGYVGWVSCLDEARGRGLGDTVTRLVTNEAFARGAQMVSLEASQFGESTYARMGYRELYRYRMLITY